MGKTFLHSGKCGDVIYSLPTIRALGGGHLYLRAEEQLGFTETLAKSLIPLLEIQPYLSGVSIWQGEPFDHNLEAFRAVKRPDITNLANAHLQLFDLPSSQRDTAWLTVPGAAYHGRPVFARSLVRFDLPGFWQVARSRYPNAIFVGTEEEHRVMESLVGSVEYWPTEDFLELARVIAGAHCFVGNQSAPYAIAEGLKVDTIQEVDTWAPNCVFDRPNGFYVSSARTLEQMNQSVKLDGNAQEIGIATQPKVELGPHVGRLGPATLSGCSVVILTYNSMATLETCVDSVLRTLGEDDELIVVDNASIDGTQDWLREASERHQFRVLLNEENLGFSAGSNLGILESRAQFIVLLNPDTQVYSGWLEAMTARFDDPTVAAVGPVSDCVAGSQYIEFHLEAGFPHLSSKELDDYVKGRHQGKSMETKLLVGFCAMLRRSLLAETGLLDEMMFLGSEDLELSWRLRALGMKLLIARDVFVRHKQGASFRSLDRDHTSEILTESSKILKKRLLFSYPQPLQISSAELWGVDFVNL